MDFINESPNIEVPLPKRIKDESLEPQVEIVEDEINNQLENCYFTQRKKSQDDEEETEDDNSEYICSLCQKSWASHRKNPNKLGCCQCDRLFHCKSLVMIHQRKHTGETPYRCEFCDKRFTEKRIFNEHRNTHLDVKPFSCSYCKDSFAQRSALNSHLKKVHLKIQPYECSICHKKFTFCATYKKHLSTHSDYYKSNKTGDDPSNKTSDYDETLVHQTGVESFSCHVCSKPFFDKSLLNLHVNSHLGIKPYSCEVCSKTFTQSSGLIKHRHIHTGVRPFVCSICNKSFAEKTYFRLHEKSHSKQKYSCHICSKTFSWKATLNKHLRLSHQEEEEKE